MTTRADQRGWGPGWPNCRTGSWVTVNGGGISIVGVRREIAPIVKFGLEATARKGYRLNAVRDDWGGVCRAISGTRTPSNHSWGLAIDLNATRNPMGYRLRTDMPSWMIHLWGSLGFGWGGYWSSKKDAMHYEFLGTPGDAGRIAGNIRKLLTYRPPPVVKMPPLKRVLEPGDYGDDVLVMKYMFAATGDYMMWLGQQGPKRSRTFGEDLTGGEVLRFKKDFNWMLDYAKSSSSRFLLNKTVGQKTWNALHWTLQNQAR
jgi:hypothetical protein